MRNSRIVHARQGAKIYEDYYKPSLNPGRFLKSILGVLLFGSSPVTQNYSPGRKR
jgi:hypothetical protein